MRRTRPTTQEVAGLTVERVDVDAVTIESFAVAAGQGPADAPSSHSAPDDRMSTDDRAADDEGTAATEQEGMPFGRPPFRR